MLRSVPLSIIRSFSLYTQHWCMSYRFADSLRAGSGRNQFCRIRTEPVPFRSCSQAVSKTLWHIPLLCVQWKTPDDGQRNTPKHVGFHSKNKFGKLMHLVGFTKRINARNRSTPPFHCVWKSGWTAYIWRVCGYPNQQKRPYLNAAALIPRNFSACYLIAGLVWYLDLAKFFISWCA